METRVWFPLLNICIQPTIAMKFNFRDTQRKNWEFGKLTLTGECLEKYDSQYDMNYNGIHYMDKSN